MLIFPNAPNVFNAFASPGSTSWVLVGSSGTTYASVAACIAAGDQPYPKSNGTVGLDPGMKLQTLTLTSVNGGAAGSAFYFTKNNQTIPPTGTAGDFVNNAGMQIVIPGTIWQVWIKLTASTDTIQLMGQY
jgi:hypothetical protein